MLSDAVPHRPGLRGPRGAVAAAPRACEGRRGHRRVHREGGRRPAGVQGVLGGAIQRSSRGVSSRGHGLGVSHHTAALQRCSATKPPLRRVFSRLTRLRALAGMPAPRFARPRCERSLSVPRMPAKFFYVWSPWCECGHIAAKAARGAPSRRSGIPVRCVYIYTGTLLTTTAGPLALAPTVPVISYPRSLGSLHAHADATPASLSAGNYSGAEGARR